KRSAHLDNKIHDDDFVVVLDRPLRKGDQRKLRFEYELETANYASSRDWYPSPPGSFEQKHTARLELTVHRKNELRSMGKMESRREEGDHETSVWVVAQPVKMLTFSTATAFVEIPIDKLEGVPQVIAFGPDYQIGNRGKVRNVGIDVANALQYFNQFLGEPVTGEQFYVTSIAALHGQAFEGFLHMTEWTFAAESPGASELFRAHETAHEWMGHKVGWATYRDQWISEAFAEYLAMQFVHDTVKGGHKFYDEMLRSYTGIVMGNMAGGFSKFNRPWLIERNYAERARLGPIGHGWRASTGEIPTGYITQTYYKGPLVLHMLRMLMQFKSGNDELFWKSIRDFVREYNGKAPTTADFRRIVERNTNADWSWFFDSWIYGADIPSYTWRYSVKAAEGGAYDLTIDVERRDVPDWFTMPIPVRIEFETGKAGFLYLPSKPGKQTVTQRIAARPKNVVFAPNYSVLGTIRRD
ncbi:MAG TPA: M1 family aminopeptidase, partial [Thermoanaerobaculia bacterium]